MCHSGIARTSPEKSFKTMESTKDEGKATNEKATAVEKLPAAVLFALTLTFASVSIDETVLFPFVPSQVASFDVTNVESELGYYAGLVGSAYYVGTLLSSSPWGLLSDRIGRKPVLVIGILSNVLWSTTYGFSTTLWQAVLFRFCNGFFGGLYPVGKTVVAEMSQSASVEGVYYVVGLGWALGFLFGPAIGGFLSQPSLKYPSLFPSGSFFDIYPYALPCITVAVISIINLGFVYKYVPETLGRARINSKFLEEKRGQGVVEISGYSTIEVMGNAEGKVGGGGEGERKEASAGQLEVEEGGRGRKEMQVEDDPGWFKAFFCERETVILSVMYAIMGFTVTSFTEVFALWALTDWDLGGLAFSTTTVGLVQASAGPLLIPFQLYLYAPMANRLGPLWTLRFALVAMSALALYPLCRAASGYTLRAVCAGVFMASRGFSVTVAYTTYLILIANSVRFPKYLGAVNGISQAVQMLLMAAAPAAGSSIYAWSITGENMFPVDFHLYFVMLGSLCMLMLGMSYLLPSSINRRKFIVEEIEKS